MVNNLPTADFLRRAKHRLGSLRGVKFTNNDLIQFQECLRLDDGAFDVWWGCDEALVAGYALGAKVAVGTTYNFLAPLMHRAVAALDAGDYQQAREAQYKVVQFLRLTSDIGLLAATKAMMSLHGLDCGPVRSPLRPLAPQEQQQFFERCLAIGFPVEPCAAVPAG